MSTFPVLGRTLLTEGLPLPVEKWIHAYWRFDEYPVKEAGFSMSIEAGPAPDGSRQPVRSIQVPGMELPCRDLGESDWQIGGEDAGVRLRLTTGGSRIQLYGTNGNGRSLYPALFVAIYESIRASGLVPLHASVIERDGSATALLAHSGTGKSSTLVQAVKAGWSPIAEDFVWLEPASRQVYGWDRGVHLWPDAQTRFAPELQGWDLGPDGKLFVPWSALRDARPRTAELRSVALLVRDPNQPSGWHPLPEREAVRALWEAIGVPLSPTSRAAVASFVPTLIAAVDTRRLVLGSTPLPL